MHLDDCKVPMLPRPQKIASTTHAGVISAIGSQAQVDLTGAPKKSNNIINLNQESLSGSILKTTPSQVGTEDPRSHLNAFPKSISSRSTKSQFSHSSGSMKPNSSTNERSFA